MLEFDNVVDALGGELPWVKMVLEYSFCPCDLTAAGRGRKSEIQCTAIFLVSLVYRYIW